MDKNDKSLSKLNSHFKPVDKDEFESISQKPIIPLGDGLLLFVGYRFDFSTITKTTVGRMNFVTQFLENDQIGCALLKCAYSDIQSEKLETILPEYCFSANFLDREIVFQKLLKWAKTLTFDLPIYSKFNVTKSHITPDMELMFDAISKFWSNYDLNDPNPNIAPFKKDVVDWLMSEAKKRNIQDFKKSRASMIDTIIRCPISRGGGNTR